MSVCLSGLAKVGALELQTVTFQSSYFVGTNVFSAFATGQGKREISIKGLLPCRFMFLIGSSLVALEEVSIPDHSLHSGTAPDSR